MSLARKPVYACRRVVIGTYFADRTGRLRPETPAVCAMMGADGECDISFHRWRKRKCGLSHALACFFCDEHGISFAVYPPGWLPYGRRPVTHVTPAGFDVGGVPPGVDGWVETAFGAAVDAGGARLWPVHAGEARAWERRYGREPYGVRRTQARHVHGVLVLLALTAELTSERGKVAALLGVYLSDVASAARARDGPELVACGAKGAELLSAAGRPDRRLLPGFLRLGADRQYWGPPTNTQQH